MIKEDALNIYTDGSSIKSPRAGGIGIRFVTIGSDGLEQIQDIQSPGYLNVTNNQMELQACIHALKEAMRLKLTIGFNEVVIYTDSRYVVENYQKAMFAWPKNRWFLHSGRPVLNAYLWKELVKCIKNIEMRVEIKWVKGHSKNYHNKAVDRMARESAKMARETRKFTIRKPLSFVHVRRKLTSNLVEIGSVEMKSQRMSVRIITCEYLTVQKVWKYKYEVISKKSKYYGKVDIIFSEHPLSTGHSYYVKVNDNTLNPRIVKVFREYD